MKVTINIDCTAAEAREMMGLPDVKVMQEKWMIEVEKKLMDDVKNFSPEKMINSWASGASPNMDWLPGAFSAFTQGKKSDD